MATHSSVLAWEIPWTEEPGGLQSMGSQRVRHDLATKQQQRHLGSAGEARSQAALQRSRQTLGTQEPPQSPSWPVHLIHLLSGFSLPSVPPQPQSSFFFSWECRLSLTPSSSLCLQIFLFHHFPHLGPQPSPHPTDGRVDSVWRLRGGAPPDLPRQMCSVPRTAVLPAHLHSLPASRLQPLTPPTQGWGSLVQKPVLSPLPHPPAHQSQ